MRRILLLVAAGWLLLPAGTALANGLKGMVRDRDSGQPLIGADLALVGTDFSASADLKGRFDFPDVPAGDYEMRVTYLGYNTRFLTGIRVTASQPTEVLVDLESFKAYQTDDMVISGARVLSTDSALMINRQQASVIGDAISAAQISRSPDGNSGDALKRVPGLTVNDGKYVFVRGIGDRYNVTEVNGVQMGGTNVDRDRKSFNFDLVPANLLANIVVIKQATPDLPGDFSGGLVRISTLEFPEVATTAASFSIGQVSGSTGKTLQYDAIGGKTDWLGRDDGGRDLPAALLDSSVVYQGTSLHNPDLGRGLPNRWTTEGRPAPPRLSFSLSHGNNVRLLGADVGFMGALSYANKALLEDENEVRRGGNPIDASGTTNHTQATLGGLANLFVRKDQHRIGFTNLYNRITDSEITSMAGQDQKKFEWQTMSWHERYQFVDKLDGNHHLPGPGGGFDLDWQVTYGESHAYEPDRRYLAYNLDFEPRLMDENMRTWTWLDEYRRGHGLDLAWSPTDDVLAKEHSLMFKAGYRRDHRSRTFSSESWYTASSQGRNFDGALAALPPESIFLPENYNEVSDPRRGAKWEYVQDTNLSGTYDGLHDVKAWYARLDLPFTMRQEELRLTGGARVELSDQAVYSVQNPLFPAEQDTSRIDTRDVLPSAALTWLYDEGTNVRLGYYESVNRPEFREISPILRRDYRTFENQRGNPNLKRALIRNYDLRVEHFQGPGEVLSASAFYKRMADAIEDTLLPEAERPTASFTSTPIARNWGIEVEGVKKLDWFDATRDLTLSANYTRVWSEVVFDNPRTLDVVEKNVRPLQGQAPWSVNLSLLYDNPRTHTTASVLVNRVGRRLDKLAENMFEYVYLESRTKLDLTATQQLPWALRLKVAVTDILAPNTIKTSATETGEQYIYSDLTESTTYGLSISGRF
jgi:hypothetical protein